MSQNPEWQAGLEQKAALDAAARQANPNYQSVKKAPVYAELDRIHDIAKRAAWAAYNNELNKEMGHRINRQAQERMSEAGMFEEAAEVGSQNAEAVGKILEFQKR